MAERAAAHAHAIGKSLEQLVGEYVEQLADADQAARDIEEWRRLSREAQGDSRGWKFNRDESTTAMTAPRRGAAESPATAKRRH